MGYSLPGAEERPFGAGRRAGPRDFDTGEGLEAIAQKVGETGDLAISLFEQEMESRVLGALSDATRAMTDLDQSVQSEPDHNKRMGMYQAGSQKISQEFRKGVKYPKYQEAFDARFFQQMESGRIAVLDNVRNARIASAQATLIMSVETQMDAAKNNPDPVRRGQIYEEALMDIEAGETGGILSPVAAARMKIRVGDAEETESIIFDSYALADEIYDDFADPEVPAGQLPGAYPQVENEDGSVSNVVLTSVGIGDRTYAIPTMVNGEQLSAEDAETTAREAGLDNYPSWPGTGDAAVDKAEKWIQENHGKIGEDGSYGPSTIEQRRARVREVPAHMRERVSGIVEGRYNREQAHEKEANDAQYIDVMKRAMTDMTTEELVDEELRARDTAMPWTPDQFAQLLSMIQERENKGKTLEAKALETTTYSDLIDEARDPMTRPRFLRRKLRVEFGHILSEVLIKTLEKDQGEGASDLDDSSKSEISIALSMLGLPVSHSDFAGVDQDVMRQSLHFSETAEAALRRAESENGRPLTRAETRVVVQSLKDKVVLRDRTWPRSDETARVYELTHGQLETATLEVPEEIETRIRKQAGLGNRDDIEALKTIRNIYAQMLLDIQQGAAPLTSLKTQAFRSMPEEEQVSLWAPGLRQDR